MKTKVFGMLLLMESLFMAAAMVVSLCYGEDDWRALFVGAFGAAVVGSLMSYVGSQMPREIMSRRDCYIIVALAWILFSIFGLIPYMAYGTFDNVTDAFFETMSGFSTTGASVLGDIEKQPHGILFWRSITQWMGGLGIVVFSFALIPVYELKSTNMFSAEVSGLSVDKLRPKIAATARRLMYIYLVFTIVCCVSYVACGMTVFDAVCHSFSTIATGGFSTHQSSIAWFQSIEIEYVCTLFMFLAGVNFSLYYYFAIGRPLQMWKNEELRWYVCVVLFFTTLFFFILLLANKTNSASLPSGLEETFRASIFNVTAIITSGGFQSMVCDYVSWGTMFFIPVLMLMVIGGCAGSTSGGIKIARLAVIVKDARNELKLHMHPKAVYSVRLSNDVLHESKVMRALAYVLIYVFICCLGSFVFTLMGMDLETSIGSAVSMLSNTGPGMGMTGPMSDYAACPALAKWIMCLLMLIGRLEIFTVLFLFVPDFWRGRV